ncbi:triacylglycerol lipase [Anaeramoeba flamelloides]|uniref:Triacylglycerol lipase n=1 Tax=Anaeramoeba flamelloides TaxID=1746091 RepID=A0ABQ8X7J7_9EUKA|nr:triacylglycerol lipase [Anaeramoeba flamelloides]
MGDLLIDKTPVQQIIELTPKADLDNYYYNSLLDCINQSQTALVNSIQETQKQNKTKQKKKAKEMLQTKEVLAKKIEVIKKLFIDLFNPISYCWDDILLQLNRDLIKYTKRKEKGNDQKQKQKQKQKTKEGLEEDDFFQKKYIFYPKKSWSILSLGYVLRDLFDNLKIIISNKKLKKKSNKKQLQKLRPFVDLFQIIVYILKFQELSFSQTETQLTKRKTKTGRKTKTKTNNLNNESSSSEDELIKQSEEDKSESESESESESDNNVMNTNQEGKIENRQPHDNFYISEELIQKHEPEILNLKKPIPYYFVYQFEKTFSTMCNKVNGAYAACGWSYKTKNIILRRIKFAMSSMKYMTFHRRAARRAAVLKDECALQYLLGLWNTTESNRLIRWIAFRPFPRIKYERLRYISGTDSDCALSKSKGTYKGRSIPIRLISKSKKPMENSTFVLHFHGGGFIAHSSFSHSPYLRNWVKETGCTVISVDYTNPPKKHFPYQTNECYQAYLWLITQKPNSKIIIAGDSAGGCLAITAFIKIWKHKLDKQPDALLLAYPVTNMKYQFGLSRVLFSNDPFFSYSILKTCLDCYLPENESILYQNNNGELKKKAKKKKKKIGNNTAFSKDLDYSKPLLNDKFNQIDDEDDEIDNFEEEEEQQQQQQKEKENNKSEKKINPLFAPLYMPDECIKAFPKTLILGGLFDPLLDDYTLLAERFNYLNHPDFNYRIYRLPHGFWSLENMLKESKIPNKHTIDFIKEVFN